MKKKKISLFEPFVGKEEVEEASRVIKGKFWASGSGEGKVKEFENAFSKFVGCKDSVALNSGTAALHLALADLNVEKTEVLVPSITFVSTAHAAVYNYARPKFVDVPLHARLNDDATSRQHWIYSVTHCNIAPLLFSYFCFAYN